MYLFYLFSESQRSGGNLLWSPAKWLQAKSMKMEFCQGSGVISRVY